MQVIKNDLKYLNYVPHDNGYGISIGSKVNLNPVDGKTPYNVFKKRWLLYKYGLDEPISDEKIFYDKLKPKIYSLNKLWTGSMSNKNIRIDINKYETIKKKTNGRI